MDCVHEISTFFRKDVEDIAPAELTFAGGFFLARGLLRTIRQNFERFHRSTSGWRSLNKVMGQPVVKALPALRHPCLGGRWHP